MVMEFSLGDTAEGRGLELASVALGMVGACSFAQPVLAVVPVPALSAVLICSGANMLLAARNVAASVAVRL